MSSWHQRKWPDGEELYNDLNLLLTVSGACPSVCHGEAAQRLAILVGNTLPAMASGSVSSCQHVSVQERIIDCFLELGAYSTCDKKFITCFREGDDHVGIAANFVAGSCYWTLRPTDRQTCGDHV